MKWLAVLSGMLFMGCGQVAPEYSNDPTPYSETCRKLLCGEPVDAGGAHVTDKCAAEFSGSLTCYNEEQLACLQSLCRLANPTGSPVPSTSEVERCAPMLPDGISQEVIDTFC